MTRDDLIISDHAARRMADRSISADDVVVALTVGETIEDYPQAYPYPARLVLADVASRSLHVVVANVPASEKLAIVTAYEPDLSSWEPGFRVRRR